MTSYAYGSILNVMRLKALAALALATFVLFPATALADTDHPVDGSGTVKLRPVIDAANTCNPPAPTQEGSDGGRSSSTMVTV